MGLLFTMLIASLAIYQCKREDPATDQALDEIKKDQFQISIAEAKEVASGYHGNGSNPDTLARTQDRADDILGSRTETDSATGEPLLYIFKKRKGFTIVSADLRVMPILAFSDQSEINLENIPNGVSLWLEIAKIRSEKPEKKEALPIQLSPKNGKNSFPEN